MYYNTVIYAASPYKKTKSRKYSNFRDDKTCLPRYHPHCLNGLFGFWQILSCDNGACRNSLYSKNGWGALLGYEAAIKFPYRLTPAADSLKSEIKRLISSTHFKYCSYYSRLLSICKQTSCNVYITRCNYFKSSALSFFP